MSLADRSDASRDWLARARRVTPGASQTRTKEPRADEAYPWFIRRGAGAIVEDVDGRTFVDWISAQGVLTLGHAHPGVTEAVTRQFRDGTIFSLPHPAETVAAERLLPLVPCAHADGMVRWVKTGSEACAAALRAARISTGRDLVLVADGSYHGWHDWIAATYPQSHGVPGAVASCVRTFRFNDVEHFERVVAEAPASAVAAIMVEPMRREWPLPGFLQHLRIRASSIGARLVFDEVVLGLRLAIAGGQDFFGVTPDLAVFGKALGGGLPLACVVGPRHLVEQARLVSSTFGGETLALAAAAAVLETYARSPVVSRLWEAGAAMRAALAVGIQGLPLTLHGSPVCLALTESPQPAGGSVLSMLRSGCARRGVLLEPNAIYPSAVIPPKALADSVDAVIDACADIRRSLGR